MRSESWACSFEEEYGKNSRSEPHDKRCDDGLQVLPSADPLYLPGSGKAPCVRDTRSSLIRIQLILSHPGHFENLMILACPVLVEERR
jgi:hypothetical protein